MIHLSVWRPHARVEEELRPIAILDSTASNTSASPISASQCGTGPTQAAASNSTASKWQRKTMGLGGRKYCTCRGPLDTGSVRVAASCSELAAARAQEGEFSRRGWPTARGRYRRGVWRVAVAVDGGWVRKTLHILLPASPRPRHGRRAKVVGIHVEGQHAQK